MLFEVIALDAGGSSVKSGRVLMDHRIVASRNDAIDTLAERDHIIGEFARIIQAHMSEALAEPAGVAFSFPARSITRMAFASSSTPATAPA